jgi:hypothetical protein
MKLNPASGAAIALAAAILILSGETLPNSAGAEDAKGRCIGANACKGQSACQTASNDCQGMNACKGQGYLELSEEDCAKTGGKFEAL